ncbi:hypothetical protein [Nocardiopsis synnemataformans]|uniref:hypothetical protein n=1 Tax=Nocardiopsis synnemataformans TaxID=61305 RepID=UPI003EBD9E54
MAMDTPDDAPLTDAEHHRREVAELRAAMDAHDDVPAYVMLYRAQQLSELRDLDLKIGLHVDQARADVAAAREMMRHVQEHRAVSTESLESVRGLQVRLGVLGRAPGQVWRGRATVTDLHVEQVDDLFLRGPVQRIARVRLVVGALSTWVWADRIWHLTNHSVRAHPLEEALDRVPAPVWSPAQDAFTAARAVATYALGYEVERVVSAPGDARLPPGVLGTVLVPADEDVQLSAVIGLAASLSMQHHLAQAGQDTLVLAAVEALSGSPWHWISEDLAADLVVWRSRALSDAQRLLKLPEVVGAIETLTAAMQDGPVDQDEVERLAGPTRAAARALQVWAPDFPQDAHNVS